MAEYIKERIIKEISISDIVTGTRITGTEDYNIDGLITNILEVGLLQPIIVTPNTNGSYRLLAGNHRKRAFEIMNKKFIPATVLILNDDLNFNQKETVFNMIEIAENLERKEIPASELFMIQQKLIDCRLMLPKNLKKAKTEVRNLDQAIEVAEGKYKEELQERRERIWKAINDKDVFDLREALLKSGYSSREVNNLEYLYNQTYALFGDGAKILKKLETADIERRLYGVLVKECKSGSSEKELLEKILETDEKTIRIILNDISEKQKDEKKSTSKSKNLPKLIKLDKVHDSHYKIKPTERVTCDFICRAEEDVFIRRAGYNVIYFEWSNKNLIGQIHSGIQSEFSFLCISSNKRDLDRLINNIIDKYEVE